MANRQETRYSGKQLRKPEGKCFEYKHEQTGKMFSIFWISIFLGFLKFRVKFGSTILLLSELVMSSSS